MRASVSVVCFWLWGLWPVLRPCPPVSPSSRLSPPRRRAWYLLTLSIPVQSSLLCPQPRCMFSLFVVRLAAMVGKASGLWVERIGIWRLSACVREKRGGAERWWWWW
ncbi:hypothetical protein V8C44DRAFT_317225 [Trichoderma aethiopicum]